MGRLQWVIWNGTERRLRTPWRLLLGTVLFVLVSIVTLLSLQLLRETAGIGLLAGFGPAMRPLVLNAISGLVVLLTLVAVAWLLDRRRLSDFGLGIDREWWVDYGFGLALGGGVMTVMVVAGIAGGWVAVESVGLSVGTLPQLVGLVAVFLLVGFYGLPVSGAELPVSLVETTTRGPQIVSGGAFGPEAGLLGLAGVGLSALGILVYCRSRDGTLAIDPDITTPDLRDLTPTE